VRIDLLLRRHMRLQVALALLNLTVPLVPLLGQLLLFFLGPSICSARSHIVPELHVLLQLGAQIRNPLIVLLDRSLLAQPCDLLLI
jgi:hypothetical protein